MVTRDDHPWATVGVRVGAAPGDVGLTPVVRRLTHEDGVPVRRPGRARLRALRLGGGRGSPIRACAEV